ncbi:MULTISPECIES: hypothetical protein [Limibacillus]|uniref:Uncharacterized protein n=1 Tax=Limibacillus halophilus TaxID=1579333 RepID=A0A839SV51_9PROT|nr:hypothetical protein [Limibacillus halophilus]MBB3065326.1 hypothetical protein [Limibacillus halophilus]
MVVMIIYSFDLTGDLSGRRFGFTEVPLAKSGVPIVCDIVPVKTKKTRRLQRRRVLARSL